MTWRGGKLRWGEGARGGRKERQYGNELLGWTTGMPFDLKFMLFSQSGCGILSAEFPHAAYTDIKMCK